ncbi:hypothetical protein [Flavobacterium mesophilum]|uniref:hypothetical protein n=1 Tax=Flavobacterium mesophilum TaxID=3143495 RepID=UPI0031D2FEA4
MKPQVRILSYSILFFLYLISTPIILKIGEKLKTDPFVTLGFGYAVFNIIYAFVALKWRLMLNILFAIAISTLALFLALQFTNLHLLIEYDPYQVKTAILANAVFAVIFWELVYQVKTRLT